MATKLAKSAEFEFATTAVTEAARLARQIQAELVSPALSKGDKSPVTVADYALQAVVARRLQEQLPGMCLVGEEGAELLHTGEGRDTLKVVTEFVRSAFPSATSDDVCRWIDFGRGDPGEQFWTLDPIDGTKGFLRSDQYAVALALVTDGRVELGVLGCPELSWHDGRRGQLIRAVRGHGATRSPLDGDDRSTEQLAVSEIADPVNARLLRSVEAGHTDLGAIDRFLHAIGTQAGPVAMDSQAKYALLAGGGAEILVRLISPTRPDYREQIWDQAAGSIIVEEAGGRVTDLDGKSLDFTHGRTLAANRGVVATNGHMHEAVLDALSAVGA